MKSAHALFAIALATTNACTWKAKKGADENVKSIVEPAAKWHINELETCWLDAGMAAYGEDAATIREFTDEEKTFISGKVNEQYTISATGVAFIGWRLCSDLKKEGKETILTLRKGTADLATSAAISIVRDKTTGAEVGTGLGRGKKVKGDDGTLLKYVPLEANETIAANIIFGLEAYCGGARMKLSKEKCYQGVALHEFGHVAGLRHEHIRPEAIASLGCDLTKAFEDFTKTAGTGKSTFAEKLGESAELRGEYDPRSIMNYCYLNVLERMRVMDDQGLTTKAASEDEIKMELSAGDRATLKSLYQA